MKNRRLNKKTASLIIKSLLHFLSLQPSQTYWKNECKDCLDKGHQRAAGQEYKIFKIKEQTKTVHCKEIQKESTLIQWTVLKNLWDFSENQEIKRQTPKLGESPKNWDTWNTW